MIALLPNWNDLKIGSNFKIKQPLIKYQQEQSLSSSEFIDILKRSTLAERRPVDDLKRIEAMLSHANLIITARQNGLLVGVSRALTDFAFCTYLSDLAVDTMFQKSGIGKELIRLNALAAPAAKLILLSAPNAVEYYPRIGMNKWEHCYVLDDVNTLR